MLDTADSTPRLVSLDPEHALRFRFTPWDARALGMGTSELLEVRYKDPQRLPELLQAYDRENAAAGIRLGYTRIHADDRLLKEELARAGFRYVETSMMVSCDGLKKHAFEKVFRRTVPLAPLTGAEAIAQVREIARDGFDYSRFHEDARIPLERARQRYYHWVDDLVAQGKHLVGYSTEGRVQAFMAYEVTEGRVTLILGGSRPGNGFVSPYFWASLMAQLRDAGHTSAQARVSAANVGVLRLYIGLFFNVKSVDLGFNKLYE
jgi:hypothetical protein